ncbi:MAG: nuclear transport factor 2 family protein [Reyranella sp.]|uniref:ester cyclase n=1 Tax=Reyranella sp. TaxID=1929291 RepID=UPI0012146E69|nr:ester cyclase [Reyranella sp.]TAJ96146.1 MAG: nuclear transport factor 2 family protein [Reyranella sp.]TBR21321.1 MAG: nuclear transport factor 2 family protein [Reyranella sp.]
MPTDLATRDLFDRWEHVWHEGRYDLVPACVAPSYIRHDESGTRTVTPAEYAAELQAAQRARPNTRIVVYDHELTEDRAWYRFSIVWNDAATGEKCSRAGLQSYRVERGKLAETWIALLPLGSAWSDTAALEHWTSPPVRK